MYFTRFLPAYRYGIMERLNRRLGGRLIVCAGIPPGGSSLASLQAPTDHSFRTIRMHNRWVRGEALHYQPFRHALRSAGPPSVVLAEESPRSITLPALLLSARKQGAGLALWGHFSSNNRTVARRGLADRYRIAMARRVDACVCYTASGKAILEPYVDQSRIFVATNTLDTDVLFALRDKLREEGREAVRRRLGIADKSPVILFLGRLEPAKGTDQLISILRLLPPTACLIVIGSGPAERELRNSIEGKFEQEVRLLGAMPEFERSAPFLYAADVLINPGYLGLNVNHAFCFGLPVVSRRSPKPGVRFHSPEVDFLTPGESGELVSSSAAAAFAGAIKAIMKERDRYSHNAQQYAEKHLTVDRMVDGLEAAVRRSEGSGSK